MTATRAYVEQYAVDAVLRWRMARLGPDRPYRPWADVRLLNGWVFSVPASALQVVRHA